MSSTSSTSNSTSPQLQVRSGSCLCRAVKYEVTGNPFTMRICHCENCKKATGSAFMTNGFFNDTQIRMLQGEDKLKVFADSNTSSGAALNRHFCSECGSNVFLRSQVPQAKGTSIIAMGTLDEKVDWKPKTELFKENRAHFVTGLAVQEKKPKL